MMTLHFFLLRYKQELHDQVEGKLDFKRSANFHGEEKYPRESYRVVDCCTLRQRSPPVKVKSCTKEQKTMTNVSDQTQVTRRRIM